MIKILTDSTADLSLEQVEEHQITIIPLYVTINGRTYMDDGVDIGRREFYAKIRAGKQPPTTSQPSVGDFQKVFRDLTADGSEVLCITISSEMSGTFAAAKAAADSLPEADIQILDSRHVSIGLGQMVLRAAREAAAGRSAEQIMQTLLTMKDESGIVFLVNTLDFLHKGGRIGTASALVGTLLNIKPILTVKGGLIQPLGKARTKQLARETMLSLLEEQVAAGTSVSGAIAHGDNPEDAGWLANQLKARYDCREFYIVEMGPVVGSHVGPGIIGAAVFPM